MGKTFFLDNPFGPAAPPPHEARALLEDYIERLIAVLDALDGDCELESLDEREPDVDDEPGNDEEPWLGRLETFSQLPGTYHVDWIADGEVQLAGEWRP